MNSLLMIVRGYILLAAVWFVVRLVRQPRDRALRAIVVCLALQLISAPQLVAVLRAMFEEPPSASITKLTTNLLLMTSWYSLIQFFLFSAGGTLRRARRESAVLGVALIGMTGAFLATPATIRERIFPSSGSLPTVLPSPGVAAFYLVGSAYLAYAAAQAALWALRYAAESTRRSRVGLRTATVGLCCMAAAATIRGIIVITRWLGGAVPHSVVVPVDALVPVGESIFIIGVSYIAAATRFTAGRVWWRHRRLYYDLRPLWHQLHTAFPEGELSLGPTSHGRSEAPGHNKTRAGRWHDWLFPRRTHRRFQRCWVEIRDGLVQLSPHMKQAGYQSDYPAHEQTAVFHEALAREQQGHLPYTRTAILIAPPAGPDLQADVAPLVRLAQATVNEGKAVTDASKTDIRDRNGRIVEELRARETQPYTEGAYALRVLSVPGRITGQLRSWPMAVTQLYGQRYVCAPNRTRDWVANLLAAGQCQLEGDEQAQHQAVLLEDERAATVVATYLRVLGRSSPQWPFPEDASEEQIRAHTSKIAVFRLDPVSA